MVFSGIEFMGVCMYVYVCIYIYVFNVNYNSKIQNCMHLYL